MTVSRPGWREVASKYRTRRRDQTTKLEMQATRTTRARSDHTERAVSVRHNPASDGLLIQGKENRAVPQN